MKVKFCGAAREVTGSQHLVTTDDGIKILLDCGLYQGRDKEMAENNRKWFFDPAEIDVLILSHSHIDHTGRVPQLVKDGFKGSIFSTNATRSLCGIMLVDSAFIQEREAEWHNKRSDDKIEPLYTKKDVAKTMNRFVGVGYERWVKVAKGVKAYFRDAGHILGSSSVVLEIKENGKKRRLGFSGDIGRPDRPILRNPLPMKQVDYIICESTYGNKDHIAPPNEIEKLLRIIKDTCVENRGKLIIPAFSVGRTQEIVFMLDQLQTAGKLPRIPVYVDSPLAVNATDVFQMHPECFDDDLNEYMITDPNPFGFKDLNYVRKVDTSKALNTSNEPMIVISSSGMITAGRIKHHIFHTISSAKNTVLIVGYCAPHTIGGQLRDGKETIKMFREELPVRAKIEVMDSFSAHADREEMAEYLTNQKRYKKLFLVHGTYERQEQFKNFLEAKGFDNIEIPAIETEVVLRD